MLEYGRANHPLAYWVEDTLPSSVMVDFTRSMAGTRLDYQRLKDDSRYSIGAECLYLCDGPPAGWENVLLYDDEGQF